MGLLWMVGLWTVLHCGYTAGIPKEPRDITMRDCSANPPYIPPTAKISTEDLNKLRQEMRNHNISAYIIPPTDPHLVRRIMSFFLIT
ncbi:PREDICTED: xaa-Pro aminopeptidase 2-like [Nanorana parkeri]|uniref:xaa-Pro aminopeptidase 2-like n=1 Tax=Nanorana parkeri TaxID=125878 RepID=UPI000854E4B4|nr:PREDICTED: xaa-Pro aminopeptidase 2-like [Nanorana parkeri]